MTKKTKRFKFGSRELSVLVRSLGVSEIEENDFREGLGPHPSEEILREIAFGRLPEKDGQLWDEHIVQCDHCLRKIYDITPNGRNEDEPHWTDVFSSLRTSPEESRIRPRLFVERPSKVLVEAPGLGTRYESLKEVRTLRPVRFLPGETIKTEVDVSADGFLSAFMRDREEHVDLVYPRYPDDDTYAARESSKTFTFEAPEEAGDYSLVTIWTKNELLSAEDIEWDNLEQDASLHVFSDLIHSSKIPGKEWTAVSCFLSVQPQLLLLQLLECSEPWNIFALRPLYPERKDPDGVRYWTPLLFGELQDGRARYGWAGGSADLRELNSKPKEELSSQERMILDKAGFMSDLEITDLLVYVNMPTQDECTLVRVTGDYYFTGVWDPESRDDYSHMVPCQYIGTFLRNPPIVSPELSSRLKIRLGRWRLENVRAEVLKLAEMFERLALV
ncbi:MAG TPA: hypothetical protein VMC85_12820 [Desulfomonilaceae bacterium]|nr:hypothetical protein [Desulfomonilaceae bacterium]